jgi:hypothetical protein
MKTFCPLGRSPGRSLSGLTARPKVRSLSPCSWHSAVQEKADRSMILLSALSRK